MRAALMLTLSAHGPVAFALPQRRPLGNPGNTFGDFVDLLHAPFLHRLPRPAKTPCSHPRRVP